MTVRGGKQRLLSEEERTLWRDVTRGIAPLRVAPAAEDADQAFAAAPSAAPARPAAAAPPHPPQKSKLPPAPAPLGRRAKQRLARGRDAIDGRLDLHGLTQARAHGVLLRFLQTAQARGAKLVMVITGKGLRGAEGGVLRRQVPLWLALPEFRELVVGFEEAHRAHGGEGALYVRVRRRRGAA
jgi:DNA-nicking Smr family endonuclease